MTFPLSGHLAFFIHNLSPFSPGINTVSDSEKEKSDAARSDALSIQPHCKRRLDFDLQDIVYDAFGGRPQNKKCKTFHPRDASSEANAVDMQTDANVKKGAEKMAAFVQQPSSGPGSNSMMISSFGCPSMQLGFPGMPPGFPGMPQRSPSVPRNLGLVPFGAKQDQDKRREDPIVQKSLSQVLKAKGPRDISDSQSFIKLAKFLTFEDLVSFELSCKANLSLVKKNEALIAKHCLKHEIAQAYCTSTQAVSSNMAQLFADFVKTQKPENWVIKVHNVQEALNSAFDEQFKMPWIHQREEADKMILAAQPKTMQVAFKVYRQFLHHQSEIFCVIYKKDQHIPIPLHVDVVITLEHERFIRVFRTKRNLDLNFSVTREQFNALIVTIKKVAKEFPTVIEQWQKSRTRINLQGFRIDGKRISLKDSFDLFNAFQPPTS